MTVTPQQIDLTIYQGATFDDAYGFELQDGEGQATPFDLTGYTARMQVRADVKSDTVLLDLTSASNSGLVVDAINGRVQFSLSPARTAALNFGETSAAVYDLEVATAGDAYVARLMQGVITLNREITR